MEIQKQYDKRGVMNRTKGQMYSWCSHTVNPIRGQCPSMCRYCYVKTSRVKNLYQGAPHLIESFFEKGLGKGKTIFVGSCFDLFAKGIESRWIENILIHCKKYPENIYLFQSKNTQNMYRYEPYFPSKIVVGTTAETDVPIPMISKAPSPIARLVWLKQFASIDKMISIEPVIEFNLRIFLHNIKSVKPNFVSIGADSKNHHLPEPPSEKIKELIQELRKFTEVKIKHNLKRLCPDIFMTS